MANNTWLSDIKNAKKSCMVQSKVKKVHYLFPDNKEMVEEYNLETEVLTRRIWKHKTELGKDGIWDVEIGDPEPRPHVEPLTIEANANQPIVSRRITKRNLEWRIRNLPYPIATYSVVADPENNCIVVKTSNKKYYKKLDVPDLERIGLLLDQANIEFTHKFNTLIITYKKPEKLVQIEKMIYEDIKALKPVQNDDNCKPS